MTTVAGGVATPTPAPALAAADAGLSLRLSRLMRLRLSVRITAGGGSAATGSFMKSATRSAAVRFSVCFSVLLAASRSALIAAFVSFFSRALFGTHLPPCSETLRQLADKSKARTDRIDEDFVESNKREIRCEQQSRRGDRDRATQSRQHYSAHWRVPVRRQRPAVHPVAHSNQTTVADVRSTTTPLPQRRGPRVQQFCINGL